MGLYVSIPLLPGVRMGGRIGGRRTRGPGLIALMFIGMAKLIWYVLLLELYMVAAVLAIYAVLFWLLWIVGRWGVMTLAHQPVLTPRDAMRRDRLRLQAWWRTRRR